MKRSDGREPVTDSIRWWQAPFWLAFWGGCLMWGAFPPLGWSFLAWLAPIPWLWLIRTGDRKAGPALAEGRRDPRISRPTGSAASDTRSRWSGWNYLAIWLGAALPWLALLEGIRRAHPANNAGLLALGVYVASYLPAFVAICRVAVHRAHVPLVIAAPVVWTACELVRGYLLTGFSMALLGHALAPWNWLIQIADLCGAYGVSFVIVLTAAAVVSLRPADRTGWDVRPCLGAVAVLAVVAAYGVARTARSHNAPGEPHLSVALLQGTRDKIFEINPERDQQTQSQYWGLMSRARDQASNLDLIVWPESTFTAGPIFELHADESAVAPPESGLSPTEFRQRLAEQNRQFADYVARAAAAANRKWQDGEFQQGDTWQLVGAETVELHGTEADLFNSALLIDPRGSIVSRYYKTHLVMFGEYIPFGDVWPWLYTLTPMPRGMSRGRGPVGVRLKGFQLCPNICFEITVPHVIRRHVNQVERESGQPVDVLVNVTDDGWFWGSTILDLQLACGIFRAVEMRRPLLVAANTGISAWIDGNGRLLAHAPKREEHLIVAQVTRDHRDAWYRWWGDSPAAGCLALTAGWLLRAGWLRRVRGSGQG